MINDYLSIRDYVYSKIKDDYSPEAERAKKYFSSEIQSFAFYKEELDQYFDELEKDNQINPEPPEQFGIRIYPAAQGTGIPSLVLTLSKLIGTNTDIENVPLSAVASGQVLQHPRLARGSGSIQVEGGDRRQLAPES